jgi:hypothetical protein
MKNNKLALTILLLCIAQANLFAQNFGIKAGVNFSNAKITMGNTIMSEDFLWNTGFHIGPIVDFPVSLNRFRLKPVPYSTPKVIIHNSQTSFLGIIFRCQIKTSLTYIDIPITAKLSYPVVT